MTSETLLVFWTPEYIVGNFDFLLFSELCAGKPKKSRRARE